LNCGSLISGEVGDIVDKHVRESKLGGIVKLRFTREGLLRVVLSAEWGVQLLWIHHDATVTLEITAIERRS
jgi:hypothetical protein